MTGEEFRAARRLLGLSQREVAAWLRLASNGDRQVRRWEDGDQAVTGPVSLAMEAFMDGWRPADHGENRHG